jgi:arylsulfatase A
MNSLFTILVLSLITGSLALAEKPNIIFILSDDLAQGDLGCYGQKTIQTPRLDQMAREGTRFLQAYCGTTVCAPSRASLMTGLHSGNSPVRGNWEIADGEGQYPLPDQTVTVAEILKSQGYATAAIGKWGMGMFGTTGDPLKQGFDHFFGYNCQRHAHSYFPTYLYRDDQRIELKENANQGRKIYAQELIQKDVLQWVRSKKEQNFFLYYAITLPHGNHEIDDFGLYKDKPWTQEQKAYAAQVTRIDSDVGALLDLLKELKIDDNTMVMIAGDNGSSFAPNSPIGSLFDQASNGMRGFKRGLYEGALRQAAIARWPGQIPAGKVSDAPWAFWDFLPTAAELAGTKIPAECKTDGLSLVGYLKGGPIPTRDSFYWELHEGKPIQALRFGKELQWKAVKNGSAAPVELYDLTQDPGEKNDLAASNPEVVEQAIALMKSSHTENPDWPLTGPAPSRKKGGNKKKAP